MADTATEKQKMRCIKKVNAIHDKLSELGGLMRSLGFDPGTSIQTAMRSVDVIAKRIEQSK